MWRVPGRYPWHEGMRISDLIPSRDFLVTREYYKQQNQITLESQASGAKPSATQNEVRRTSPDINWDYAVVQRMDPQDLSTRLIPFNLGKACLNMTSRTILLCSRATSSPFFRSPIYACPK